MVAVLSLPVVCHEFGLANQGSQANRADVCGKIFWQRGQAPFAGQRPEGCFAQMVPVPLPLPENLAAHERTRGWPDLLAFEAQTGAVRSPAFRVVPHTHWEGAVFKTREEYLDMGLVNIVRALRLPNYCFTLDQACYVEPLLESQIEAVAMYPAHGVCRIQVLADRARTS
jgi:hypothetical protein